MFFPLTDSPGRPCDALQGRMCAVCSVDGQYLGLTPDGTTEPTVLQHWEGLEFKDSTGKSWSSRTALLCPCSSPALRLGDASSGKAQQQPLQLSRAISWGLDCMCCWHHPNSLNQFAGFFPPVCLPPLPWRVWKTSVWAPCPVVQGKMGYLLPLLPYCSHIFLL